MQILDVPIIQQVSDSSCGAASLLSLLIYWKGKKKSPSQSDLCKALHLDPAIGIEAEEIVKVAKKYGLNGEVVENTPQSRLVSEFNQGTTIILQLQAWSDNKNQDYKDDWEDGHYVVLTAMNDGNFLVMDPLSPLSYRSLTLEALQDRWHGYIGDRKTDRIAIFLRADHEPRGEALEELGDDPLP